MKPASLIFTIVGLLAPAFAQNAPPPPPYDQQGSQQPQQNAPLLTPEQLDTIVAPVALYPDPILGQVLAASTYPLEIVEAQQWLQQNRNLQGQDLLNAARQQNWDPSVQALVAFPDILTLLNRDVRWTGDLGNAYLAQQQDVMNAVQRMRFRARQNGRLESTPQQTVTTQSQNGQDAVVIEPSNPQEVYVPTYNPDYVWGPPAYGAYPPLWYPSDDFGFGFGPGIYIGGFFPSWGGYGWGGWGLGWGWGCGWFGGRGIFVNNFFFSRYGFRGNGFYGGVGRYAWQHDAFHRGGVPYRNASVAARFNNSRFASGRMNAAAVNGSRSFAGNTARSFSGGGSPAARSGNYSNAYRGSAGAYNRTPSYGGQAYRGNASPAPRTYAPPRANSAPSAPRSFSGGGGARSFGGGGGGARSFGGGGGGGHFGGGGGGGHAGGGGGHGGGHR
jgi:hypothetical protein